MNIKYMKGIDRFIVNMGCSRSNNDCWSASKINKWYFTEIFLNNYLISRDITKFENTSRDLSKLFYMSIKKYICKKLFNFIKVDPFLF